MTQAVSRRPRARTRVVLILVGATGVLLVAALAVAVFGPWRFYFIIPGGDTITTFGETKTLKSCPPSGPIPVARLNTLGTPTCDLSGATIEVAPGTLLDVPDDAHAITETDAGTFGIVNLRGRLGVVVYTAEQQWGNPEAVRLVRKAGWKP